MSTKTARTLGFISVFVMFPLGLFSCMATEREQQPDEPTYTTPSQDYYSSSPARSGSVSSYYHYKQAPKKYDKCFCREIDKYSCSGPYHKEGKAFKKADPPSYLDTVYSTEWTLDKNLDDGQHSSPVKVGDLIVYMTNDGVVHGIYKNTGRQLWEVKTFHKEEVKHELVVVDDIIYAMSGVYLWAINGKYGRVVWKKSYNKQDFPYNPYSQLVTSKQEGYFFTSNDNTNDKSTEFELIVIDLKTGTIKHSKKFKTENPKERYFRLPKLTLNTDNPSKGYFKAGRELYFLDLTSKEVRTKRWIGKKPSFDSNSVYYNNDRLFFPGIEDRQVLNASTGDLILNMQSPFWTLNDDDMLFLKEVIVSRPDARMPIVAYSQDNWEKRWSLDFNGYIFSKVSADTDQNILYFQAENKSDCERKDTYGKYECKQHIHAVHTMTGKVLWRYETPNRCLISGSLLVTEKRVIGVCRNGTVFSIEKPKPY